MGSRQSQLLSWLPQLNPQVWILAFGRFLSQIGTGLTLFYVPIFLVNQIGLSATAVGIAIASGQISGILGRVLGGSFADSPQWGRRKTLVLSALISALGTFILALAQNFPTVIFGNLLLGLGIGLYWPATEAMIADLTRENQRREAYATARLADNIGLQLGIILAGIILAKADAYRTLFILDGISFVLFAGVIFGGIQEPTQPQQFHQSTPKPNFRESWGKALKDRFLLTFVGVNILFTLYISQIHSTIPLYLTNFVKPELSETTINNLFSWHIAVSILLQLPVARWLNRWNHAQALIISAMLWGVGFGFVCLTGIASNYGLFYGTIALGILAIATVSYTPSASAFIAEIAPDSLRGTYQAINAQCWAIGYLIGPPLGGWALDQSPQIMYNFWITLAISVGFAILILFSLSKQIEFRKN